MSESTGKPAHEYAVKAEPFMAIDRITQELITQKLKAAAEQLDIIGGALRENGGTTDPAWSTSERSARVRTWTPR